MGANHSLRVAKAIAAGGYDERLSGVALREETDLAMRLFASGGQIAFDPMARLLHLAVPTGGCRKTNRLDISAARSNLLFAVKHVTRLKRHWFRELWFSFRLGVMNKASLNNPVVLFITLLKFLWLFVEIPFTLCTKRPNSF
jgi:GT2 family glycosyltransferase